MRLEYQIVLAILLDALIGDPRWFPHPVKGIGWVAVRLERPLRRAIRNERLAGCVTAVLIIGGTAASVALLLYVARMLHPVAADAAGVVVIYTSLAARDLGAHAAQVFRALRDRDLDASRKAVAMVVGRDTDRLTEPEVSRAAVETVAENLVDGVTAPLLFAVAAGPVGALTYKAINTLDSTFGYRTERYRMFGWASARLDDIANWLPARLTAPFVVAGAMLTGLSPGRALRVLWRDGGKHDSPNAGITEAAFAGALGVKLGGLNYYFGKPHGKPVLGDEDTPISAGHILKANVLMYTSTVLFALTGLGIRFSVG